MSSDSEKQPRTTRQILNILQPITEKVHSILGRVRGIVVVYLAGAVALWLVLVLPGGVDVSWVLGFSLLGLLILMIPAALVFLFYLGLVSVVNLPMRLLEKAGVGETHARSMVDTARSADAGTSSERAGKLLRTLYDVRGLVKDSKGLLLEYTALLRLVNPFVLAIVGIALAAGFLEVVAAVIGLLIVFF